jgi:uncharacterized protein YxeA
MKNVIFTLCLLLMTSMCFAQGTTKKTTTRRPPPYLYKKDFNEKMSEVDERIKKLEASNASLSARISKDTDSFYVLKQNIDTIIQILNEYNIKIRLTSDSLTSLTSFSIAEFREITKKDIANLQDETMRSNRAIRNGVLGLAALLILLIVAFIVLNTRINQRLHDLDDEIEESIDESDTKHSSEREQIRKQIKRELLRDIDLFRYALENKITKSHEELSNSINELKKK